MKIKYLGHSSFIVEDKVKVAFDPYNVKTTEKVDYIFISHAHYDHCSPKDVARLADPAKTIVVVPADCKGKVKKYAKQVIAVEPGLDYNPGLAFKTVPAYNIGKIFHPRKSNWVGYIVYLEESVYHCGDTDFIPEMTGLAPGIVLIPVGGTYTMDAQQAAEAVKAMNPKKAIPMHYGSVVGSLEDAQKFQQLVQGKAEILQVE